ncbi:MAG: hypothetical protein RL404_2930 [Pseudomonadota bacterium]|jgi:acetyl esterase/lipase
MIEHAAFASWVSPEAQATFRIEADAPRPPNSDIATLREHYDAYNRCHLATALDHYLVEITRSSLGGVAVDIVQPEGGTTNENILLCLHGGAFMWGRGAGALLEAVPVAATSGSKVIAVEYALAPEAVFPTAVDDVLAVYNALQKTTPASRIGIYGCSAGGVLTAQTVARLIAEKQPLPGAIAMFCGTGLEMVGDSAATVGALTGQVDAAAPDLAALPYFSGTSTNDPLVIPGHDADALSAFPPSLLVTGTRDFAASSVMTMHRRLRAAGAEADLVCFDGMWHAFHMATTLPEAREAFAAVTHFFNRHLD